jgi:hypothetical protein
MKPEIRTYICPMGEKAVIAGEEMKLISPLDCHNSTAMLLSEDYCGTIDSADGPIDLMRITYVAIPDEVVTQLFSRLIEKNIDKFICEALNGT